MPKTNDIVRKQFEALFREYFTVLCYFAKKYLGDLDNSKEIVHSVFVKIWENRNDFEFDKPAKSYLFTSVYNRSMNKIRDQKKFDNSNAFDLSMENDGEFSDTLETAELEAKINNSVHNLPEKCRKVFEMNRFDGKKYQEIANELGISVKTVEAQMSKALKILREELKDYLYWLILFLWIN